MKGYDATTFGDRMRDYDSMDWALETDQEAASDFLASLAPGGSALELGIGTGRVAIPLARRGVRVVGVDSSDLMGEQLAEKVGDLPVEFVLGNFASDPQEGQFSLAFAANSTFFLLRTQEEQVRCFRHVASRLEPGGSFVLQTLFPGDEQFQKHEHVSAIRVEADRAITSITRHERTTQQIDSQRVETTRNGISLYPLSYRYAWPSELDLMAQLAGLALVGRWDGWAREPFTTNSDNYVSQFQKA
ncbi:MAG TPA: class I SAM-dependent methyltransferase [Trebonia sp.]|jgi:SAM-dependent methyltransferase|nr:class I SAM-dependent methyltransferase [Trebonia sp.]